jgi:hypothetical protein
MILGFHVPGEKTKALRVRLNKIESLSLNVSRFYDGYLDAASNPRYVEMVQKFFNDFESKENTKLVHEMLGWTSAQVPSANKKEAERKYRSGANVLVVLGGTRLVRLAVKTARC